MEATIIYISSVLAFGILVIIGAHYKRERNLSALKIEYLNNALNAKNIDSFVLTRTFFDGPFFGRFPLIVDEYLVNYSYRAAYEEYKRAKKTFVYSSLIIVPILLVLIYILVTQHADYLQELMDNSKKMRE